MQPVIKALALIPAVLLHAWTSPAQDGGNTSPSLELLEFLGSGETVNDAYVDPLDMETISLRKRTHSFGKGAHKRPMSENKEPSGKILPPAGGSDDQDSD